MVLFLSNVSEWSEWMYYIIDCALKFKKKDRREDTEEKRQRRRRHFSWLLFSPLAYRFSLNHCLLLCYQEDLQLLQRTACGWDPFEGGLGTGNKLPAHLHSMRSFSVTAAPPQKMLISLSPPLHFTFSLLPFWHSICAADYSVQVWHWMDVGERINNK